MPTADASSPFFLHPEREHSDSGSSARGQVLDMPGVAIFRSCLRRASGSENAGLTQGLGFARRIRRPVEPVGCVQRESAAHREVTNGHPRRRRQVALTPPAGPHSLRPPGPGGPHWHGPHSDGLTNQSVTDVCHRLRTHRATGACRAAERARVNSSYQRPFVAKQIGLTIWPFPLSG